MPEKGDTKKQLKRQAILKMDKKEIMKRLKSVMFQKIETKYSFK